MQFLKGKRRPTNLWLHDLHRNFSLKSGSKNGLICYCFKTDNFWETNFRYNKSIEKLYSELDMSQKTVFTNCKLCINFRYRHLTVSLTRRTRGIFEITLKIAWILDILARNVKAKRKFTLSTLNKKINAKWQMPASLYTRRYFTDIRQT